MAALVGCGDDSDSNDGGGDAPVERADDPRSSRTAGSRSRTRPPASPSASPGWSEEAQKGGQGTVLRSPDKLVAVSISADRSAGALALDPEDFASQTAKALASGNGGKGSEGVGKVEIGPSQKADSPYEGATVGAVARSDDGSREGIEIAVLRRPEVAVYVLVARGNADRPSAFADSARSARSRRASGASPRLGRAQASWADWADVVSTRFAMRGGEGHTCRAQHRSLAHETHLYGLKRAPAKPRQSRCARNPLEPGNRPPGPLTANRLSASARLLGRSG